MKYTCPVCGYDNLRRPPMRHSICICCGTQFDYDDATVSHARLRTQWIRDGANWWSEDFRPPYNWSPSEQLLNIGYEVTDADIAAIYRDSETTSGRISVGGSVRLDKTGGAGFGISANFWANVTTHRSSNASSKEELTNPRRVLA